MSVFLAAAGFGGLGGVGLWGLRRALAVRLPLRIGFPFWIGFPVWRGLPVGSLALWLWISPGRILGFGWRS
jgi:hypothetical protein